MRRALWTIHSWAGLFTGVGLLFIGLSGSLLVFRNELNRSLFPKAYAVAGQTAKRLPIDTLLHRAEAQLPGFEITGWHLQAEGSPVADELYLLPHGGEQWQTATLDPHSGQLLALPHAYTGDFLGWILEFHKSFLGGRTGEAIVGILGICLLLLGLSGLWLHRGFWRQVPRLRLRQGARLALSDLHKLVGASSALLLLILGFTGAYWNLTELTESEPTQPRISERLYPESLRLGPLLQDATLRLPGFETHFVSLPSSPDNRTVILWGAVTPLPFWRDPYGSLVSYDARDSHLLSVSDIRESSLWAQIRSAFRPLHFGSFGGLPVKLLYAAAGLAPGALALSGLLIARLRRRAQHREFGKRRTERSQSFGSQRA